MDEILTEIFRQCAGYCPFADGDERVRRIEAEEHRLYRRIMGGKHRTSTKSFELRDESGISDGWYWKRRRA